MNLPISIGAGLVGLALEPNQGFLVGDVAAVSGVYRIAIEGELLLTPAGGSQAVKASIRMTDETGRITELIQPRKARTLA